MVIISAGCAKMPQESSSSSGNSADTSTGSASVSAGTATTEPVVSFSTTFPTPTDKQGPTFSVPPPDSVKPEDNLSVIYQETVKLNYSVISFDYYLKYPPMVFYYSAEVPVVSRTKTGTSQFGGKDDYSYSSEVPNPLANYRVTVYNRDNGEVVRDYDIERFNDKSEKGDFKILEGGDYHIEITGNLATVNTTVRVPLENLNTDNQQ
ncbi:hypothetical protein J2128_000509 [Methanomicrobium sp. W14]|uniref:hypothetical protein n=1 Tax=Methanomicrobium sp. W14 TaxID=2817839 RepID=UPI001AEA36DD|nr:hypothetical protein [Methanomicrobium sp. W14]MBP2132588.1 hypothetical protein [Methanomicrobium sp. W14]